MKILNKHSNDLDPIEDFDGAKIDLIVSEIFDDGLLGEGCLDTFYNALFVNKLIRYDPTQLAYSRVIAQSAKVFICAVQSAKLRSCNRFVAEFGNNFKILARCLDNSERFELDFNNPILNFEPYTTENLNNLDDIEYLSQPIEIAEFQVRFDDEKMLER